MQSGAVLQGYQGIGNWESGIRPTAQDFCTVSPIPNYKFQIPPQTRNLYIKNSLTNYSLNLHVLIFKSTKELA
jgi:hypothetical protein